MKLGLPLYLGFGREGSQMFSLYPATTLFPKYVNKEQHVRYVFDNLPRAVGHAEYQTESQAGLSRRRPACPVPAHPGAGG